MSHLGYATDRPDDERPSRCKRCRGTGWEQSATSSVQASSAPAPDESETVGQCADCDFTGYPAAMVSHQRLSHGPRRDAPDSDRARDADVDESEGVTRCGREDCAYTGYPAAMASHRRLSHGPRRAAPDANVKALLERDRGAAAVVRDICEVMELDEDDTDDAVEYPDVNLYPLIAKLRTDRERVHLLLAEEQQRREAAEAALRTDVWHVRLHSAICDAVALLGAASIEPGLMYAARDRLRQALIDYADAVLTPAASADPDRGGTAA